MVDRKSGTTKGVDAKVITVAGQAPQLDDGTAKSLAAVVLAMQSDDTSRRRAAREELTKLIDGGKPELVSQLIRQMPVGTSTSAARPSCHSNPPSTCRVPWSD